VAVNVNGSQTFNVTASSGYEVETVLADGVPVTLSEGQYTFGNVTENHTLSAAFSEIPAVTYDITVDAGANGVITPAGIAGIVKVNEGGAQTFDIIPDVDYHIATLTIDGVGVAPVSSYTFENVTANHTIAATFAAGRQGWPLEIVGYTTVNITQTEFEGMAAAYPSNEYASIDKNTSLPDGNLWKGVAL
jgi:hypothetical protein